MKITHCDSWSTLSSIYTNALTRTQPMGEHSQVSRLWLRHQPLHPHPHSQTSPPAVEDPYLPVHSGPWHTMAVVVEQHSLILQQCTQTGGAGTKTSKRTQAAQVKMTLSTRADTTHFFTKYQDRNLKAQGAYMSGARADVCPPPLHPSTPPWLPCSSFMGQQRPYLKSATTLLAVYFTPPHWYTSLMHLQTTFRLCICLCPAQLPHLSCPPAADTELLDVLHGRVKVHLVLGTRLPALILSLEVLAWSGAEGRGHRVKVGSKGAQCVMVVSCA